MSVDEVRRRSRWILRALEWDEPRAKYPNIWHDGMPQLVLAYETVASRLRLGDLVAVFHPASQKRPERAERFLGLVRVTAIRRAHDPTFAWLEMESAHRFRQPLDLGESPRRVFLCCDPGWPEREVALFRRIFDAAVAEGWEPAPEEREEGARPGRGRRSGGPVGEGKGEPAPAPGATADVAGAGPEEAESREDEPEEAEREAPDAPGEAEGPEKPSTAAGRRASTILPANGGRLFGGADYGGDMRDPRTGTWLALLHLEEDRLRVVRLEATGRSGFQAVLRDVDPVVMRTEAFGLAFPFGLPLGFAERILGGTFPEEGWWALAKRLDRMSRPEYLVAVEEFRETHGEPRRFTDEAAGLPSPLHRREPDLGPITYHGIRMIAEERSRYTVRPFETATGRRLLEVSPEAFLRQAGLEAGCAAGRILEALPKLARFPVDVPEPFRRRCLGSRDALDAVLAARCAAAAVLTGEADRSPAELGDLERIRREGWIYGLTEGA
jgi:hypothetical protein